jgi:acyl-CoA synthetase (AMP-forming)/AMP-acid ligase II
MIKKGGGRKADAPAILSPVGVLTFGELIDSITAYGQAIVGLVPDDSTVAVAAPGAGDALPLLLGALAAGKRVLVCDVSSPQARLSDQLTQVEAGAVLVASTPTGGQFGDYRVITRQQIEAFEGERDKLRPTKAQAPAVVIPADGELVVHSQYGLVAMGVTLPAFIPDLKSQTLVAPPPLWTWEGLATTLAALMNGATVADYGLDEVAASAGIDPGAAWTMLMREQADEIAKAKHGPAVLGELAHVFVSTAYFDHRWRRALESGCRREVLPIWGTPELGPAVAAHPTWFPTDAHGIPLVNVRVVPVDPESGEVSVVPWEMLEAAEIGVESPSSMLSFVREGADEALRAGKILRTFVGASVDHVGVVNLHRPPKHARGGRLGGAAA